MLLHTQVGNASQGAYCLANGFLNGLAVVRRASGLKATAVSVTV